VKALTKFFGTRLLILICVQEYLRDFLLICAPRGLPPAVGVIMGISVRNLPI
jgi:hypothetical protein